MAEKIDETAALEEQYKKDMEKLEEWRDDREEDKDFEMSGAIPDINQKDSHFRLMRELINTKNSTKIANLDKAEVGKATISLRGCQYIENYCRSQDLHIVADYYHNKGEIVAASSMGKKGFFTKIMVSQIRTSMKTSTSGGSGESKKWWQFGKSKDNMHPQGEEE